MRRANERGLEQSLCRFLYHHRAIKELIPRLLLERAADSEALHHGARALVRRGARFRRRGGIFLRFVPGVFLRGREPRVQLLSLGSLRSLALLIAFRLFFRRHNLQRTASRRDRRGPAGTGRHTWRYARYKTDRRGSAGHRSISASGACGMRYLRRDAKAPAGSLFIRSDSHRQFCFRDFRVVVSSRRCALLVGAVVMVVSAKHQRPRAQFAAHGPRVGSR